MPIESKFAINEWVLIDRPPLKTDSPTANFMTISSYDELQHRTTAPYKISEVRPNTIGIEEFGDHNTMSIHWVNQALHTTTKDGEDMLNASEGKVVTLNNTQSGDQEHECSIEETVQHYG